MSNEGEPGSRYPIQKPPQRKFASPEAEMIFLLKSIRSMLIFFTVLTILGIIAGIFAVTDLIHAANNNSGF